MVSQKKISILGLDNAGKTSSLIALKKKFDVPKEVKGLKPTLRVERSNVQFLDHIINIMDMGGQEKYREEYLAHKDRYLAGMDLLFFVIDVQDGLRIDESFDYFLDITNYLAEIEEFIPIQILLHKVDPKITEDPTIIKNLETIMLRFSNMDDRFQLNFTATNIFEIHTIIQAFSEGIAMLYANRSDVILKFLLDFVEKMENVMALLLFEQNGIELGSYFLDHITLPMQKKILTLYEIAQRRIMDTNSNTYEFSDRLDAFTKVSGVMHSMDIEGLKFYMLLVVEEHSEEVVVEQLNYFEEMYAEMNEILRNLILDDPSYKNRLSPM